MNSDCYERLADALDRLPNRFPRTPSNIEIDILKKIFSPEDAELACQLTGEYESAEAIAKRADLPVKKTAVKLLRLAKRRLVWINTYGERAFRLAPFVVGIYEAQVATLDHELAHLVEHYMQQGGAQGIMGPEPAIQRVVPASGSVNSEWVLPYDDIRAMLENAISFGVSDCICRKKQDLLGNKCDYPTRNCMTFFAKERPETASSISKEEALAILDEAKEAGLVHTVSNIAEGVFYLCNCCGCCCDILRGITQFGVRNSVARSNYLAWIDEDRCHGCGNCAERCHTNAIFEAAIFTVKPENCIGCGACVSVCPSEAVALKKKPEAEIVHPPQDFESWERLRAKNHANAHHK